MRRSRITNSKISTVFSKFKINTMCIFKIRPRCLSTGMYHTLLCDLLTPADASKPLSQCCGLIFSGLLRAAHYEANMNINGTKKRSRKPDNPHDGPPGSSPAVYHNKMSRAHIWPFTPAIGFDWKSAMPLRGHPDFHNTYVLLIASP